MKHEVEQILHVKMQFDRHEMIMFTKGGVQKIELPGNFFSSFELQAYENEEFPIVAVKKIIISAQLDPDQKSGFNWITENKYTKIKNLDDELLKRLELLTREATEEIPKASVAEAIQTLIDCCKYLLTK